VPSSPRGRPARGKKRLVTVLRVMSWNLRGAARPRLDAVVEVVQAHEPDVLALQEVRRGQARRIAGLLGWRKPAWAFKHNPYWPAWWLAEGLAVLSRHRLAVHPAIVLTPSAGRRAFQRRILVPAEVLLDEDRRALVIDAHLSSGDDDAPRAEQGRHVLSILPGTLPTVLVGDLNATPRAESIKVLLAGGFVDAWPAGGAPGETGFTYPANAPRRRIDYVMVHGEARVASATVAADLGAAMSGLSDHRPLVVDLELAGDAAE
jgi:endonuclease/exonuclease/phosphatase family metal-dependent hydrolase